MKRWVKNFSSPFLVGRKTENEKFAGAEITYTIEVYARWKALQVEQRIILVMDLQKHLILLIKTRKCVS